MSTKEAMKGLVLFLKFLETPKIFHNCQYSSFVAPSQRLKIGDKAAVFKQFSSEDVQLFADLCGDHNPIHLDTEYAAQTRYKQCIVHGVLTVGLLSGILGMTLPGPGSVIISHQMKYPAPLYIDEEVKAEVEVLEINGRRVTFDLTCSVAEEHKVGSVTY